MGLARLPLTPISYLNIQRSNLSAILNELVRENKLEKISGRPVLYKIHNKLDENNILEGLF